MTEGLASDLEDWLFADLNTSEEVDDDESEVGDCEAVACKEEAVDCNGEAEGGTGEAEASRGDEEVGIVFDTEVVDDVDDCREYPPAASIGLLEASTAFK